MGHNDLGHDDTLGHICGHIDEEPAGRGGNGHIEGERLAFAAAQGERGGRDVQAARIDAEGADGRISRATAEHDAIVFIGLDRGHVEAQGIGRFVGRAGREIVEKDRVLRAKAAPEHTDARADWTAVDLEREHVATYDLGVDDFGVDFRIGRTVLGLDAEGYEIVVSDFIASVGQLVLEFVDAAAEAAGLHRETLAIDDDLGRNAGGIDRVGLRRHAQGECVNLRRILRQGRRGEIRQYDGVTTTEQGEAERGEERKKDFSRERNSVGMHWTFERENQIG